MNDTSADDINIVTFRPSEEKMAARELRRQLIECSKRSIANGWYHVTAELYAAECELDKIIGRSK